MSERPVPEGMANLDGIEVIRFETRRTWEWLNVTVEGLNDDMVNWQPPGIANSIAATYAHTIICADEDLNKVLDGRPTLMVSRWQNDIGLSELPIEEFGWEWHDWAVRVRMDWEKFRRYAADVESSVYEFLEKLGPEILKRPVDMSQWELGMWTGYEMYALHGYIHPRLHGGEIACLKGLQGQPAWRRAWQSSEERPNPMSEPE